MLNARTQARCARSHRAGGEAHGVRVVRSSPTCSTPTPRAGRGTRARRARAHRHAREQRGGGGNPTGCTSSPTTTGSRASSSTSSRRCELTPACLPTMLERGWGRIVRLASTYGVEPGPLLRALLGRQGRAAQLLEEPVAGVLGPGRARQLRDPRHHHHRGHHETPQRRGNAQGTTADDVMARMMEKDPVPWAASATRHEVAAAVCSSPARPPAGSPAPPRGRRRHPPQHLTPDPCRSCVAKAPAAAPFDATSLEVLGEEGGELAALDLAHGVAGEAVDEQPALGHLVLRQVGQAVRASSSSLTVAPSPSCTAPRPARRAARRGDRPPRTPRPRRVRGAPARSRPGTRCRHLG